MQVFAMRSMASGAAFHRAYLHATQQAFLEAHEHAFAYFGGRFTAEFCTPGKGHEKGGVEGEGGYFRRNHLVLVPAVADLDALNAFC